MTSHPKRPRDPNQRAIEKLCVVQNFDDAKQYMTKEDRITLQFIAAFANRATAVGSDCAGCQKAGG
jgi:hypothetical protein